MPMAKILIRRCACPCDDGIGRCRERLAGEALGGGNAFHQSPTATTAGSARRHRSEQLIDESAGPSFGLVHSIWRIRSRGIVDFVMIDRAFVARLWKSIRSSVHDFQISRMQKKIDKKFRVVEVSECERRRHFSSKSGRRPPLSVCCNQLKRSVRRRVGQAAAVVACPNLGTKNSNAGWGLTSSRRLAQDTDDDATDTDEDSVTDEIAPINWASWKEVEIEEFSPRIEIAAFSRASRSMEDFGSLKWEEGFLHTTASTKPALSHGEGSSTASTTGFEQRRWENRYRLSDKSPQLLQPVKGKLTTLSSLLRTMSDRYARRTGKLSMPVNDKSSNNNINNKNKRPVLTQSQSAAPWAMHSQHQLQNPHRSNSTSRFVVDNIPAKRYDNPFQDFLRQSFAERHSRSVHETDRQR